MSAGCRPKCMFGFYERGLIYWLSLPINKDPGLFRCLVKSLRSDSAQQPSKRAVTWSSRPVQSFEIQSTFLRNKILPFLYSNNKSVKFERTARRYISEDTTALNLRCEKPLNLCLMTCSSNPMYSQSVLFLELSCLTSHSVEFGIRHYIQSRMCSHDDWTYHYKYQRAHWNKFCQLLRCSVV
jgi:hypothetical protein